MMTDDAEKKLVPLLRGDVEQAVMLILLFRVVLEDLVPHLTFSTPPTEDDIIKVWLRTAEVLTRASAAAAQAAPGADRFIAAFRDQFDEPPEELMRRMRERTQEIGEEVARMMDDEAKLSHGQGRSTGGNAPS